MTENLLTAAVLAVLAGFAGAYEIALLSVSRSRLEELLEEHREDLSLARRLFLERIVAGKESVRLSATLLHALALGALLYHLAYVFLVPLGQTGGPGYLSWQAALAAAGCLIAGATIRALAATLGGLEEEGLVLHGARWAWILTLPLIPMTWLFLWLCRGIARFLGHKTERDMSEEERREEREEEVIAALSDGELDGVVEEDQREMIEGIFELKDSDVADVFTPRTEMISISSELSVADAVALAVTEGFSRLPVHEDTRDNIIGIFYVRDALQYWGQPAERCPALREILRKPLFVPETKKVSDLLRQMRDSQTHMAIVLDEYGGTAGLVTIEDIIEEIVGDIHDEYDKTESTKPLIQHTDGTIRAEGHVHVSDLNEILGDDIIPEDDDYETVGGFVLDNLGHIPTAGESFEFDGLAIKVLAADERRVERVEVRRITQTAEA